MTEHVTRLRAEPVGSTGIAIRFVRSFEINPDPQPRRADWRILPEFAGVLTDVGVVPADYDGLGCA